MIPADIVPPDEPYSVEETAVILRRSGRQVLRYLKTGALRGSRASGSWSVTAVQIWEFQGIADEMMANWREYCLSIPGQAEIEQKQGDRDTGE